MDLGHSKWAGGFHLLIGTDIEVVFRYIRFQMLMRFLRAQVSRSTGYKSLMFTREVQA